MFDPQSSQKESFAELRSAHTPSAIHERLQNGFQHSYLRDFVYGAIDGAVTTFAVVSGVAGANLPSKIIIILGLANLLGDGFSMAASNFLGTRAEEQFREKTRQIEKSNIQRIPDGEKEEIRQIFAAKGFKGKELERAVKIITSDQEQWVNTMLTEELGLTTQGPSPLRAALCTFSAFLIAGFLPLLSFIWQWMFPSTSFEPFMLSAMITGLAFFGVGALKGRFVGERWQRAGFETLAVGGCAAFLAFMVGVLLKGIINSAVLQTNA